SGSPVLNDQWQVVALHHMGEGKKNSSGQYVDRDGNPIPIVGGKIDAAKVVWEANEGIRVSKILQQVFAATNSPILQGLKVDPQRTLVSKTVLPTEKVAATNTDSQLTEHDPMNSNSNVDISFPATLLSAKGIVRISIENGAITEASKRPTQSASESLL